ncbi:MAG: amidohydrolase family protein [Bryobacteraceae bacterium]
MPSFALAALILFASLLAGQTVPQVLPIAIRNVTIVDVVDGKSIPDSALLLRDHKIAYAGPSAGLVVPPGTKIVDGAGKFAIPGLWDMHVHLWETENLLPLYVAYGVTGVQDMGSNFDRVKAWRKAIEDGKAIGPRIITPGPAVDGRPSPEPKLPVLVATTAIEARKAFDKLYDLDVDFTKVLSGLPRDAYFALAEQTRHWNLPLRGHVPTSITVWEAVEARQRTIEHLFGVPYACSSELPDLEPERQQALLAQDRAALRKINERAENSFSEDRCAALFRESAKLGTAYTPSLTLWRRMLNLDLDVMMKDPRLAAMPAPIRKAWPDPRKDVAGRTPQVETLQRQYLQKLARIVLLLREGGVMTLAGTDTGDAYTVPGATLQDELVELVQAGLKPVDALRAATLTPAQFLGLTDSMGKIAPGMAADLVLLDADPLEDIRAVRKIDAVFTRGRYFTRDDLDRLRTPAK